MKKKIFVFISVIILLITSLVACGTDDEGSKDNQVRQSEETTTVLVENSAESEEESSDLEDLIETLNGEPAFSNEEAELEEYMGDKITLKLTSHDPETSATGTFLNNFAAKVSELSNGLITIDVYHGGTLAGPKDSIDAVSNGSVDIAWGMQSFYDGLFPVTEAMMLPMLDITSAPQATEALWELWNTTEYLQDEYSKWHVLLLHCNCQTPLIISSKSSVQPKKISELKGLTCRGNAGPPTMFIEELGMTPKGCAITELYSNLEKGEMDACLTDWHGVSAFKINEVASMFYDENLGTMTYFLLMNRDKYDDLDPAAREIIDRAAAESIQYTDAWDIVQDDIKAKAKDEGKIVTFPEDEEVLLEDAAEAVKEAWINKTPDGQEIYDMVEELLAAYK